MADTSSLVSLSTVADHEWNQLDHLLDQHTVLIPQVVLDELAETATYDDASGQGTTRAHDRTGEFAVRDGGLDESFPLDDGEKRQSRSRTTVEPHSCSATSSIGSRSYTHRSSIPGS